MAALETIARAQEARIRVLEKQLAEQRRFHQAIGDAILRLQGGRRKAGGAARPLRWQAGDTPS